MPRVSRHQSPPRVRSVLNRKSPSPRDRLQRGTFLVTGGWWSTVFPRLFHYTIAIGVIALTVSMTVQVANRLLPSLGFFRYLVVLVFDLGVLHWLNTFLRVAKSTPQLALSGFLLLVSVIGVAVMIGTELLVAGGQQMVSPPAWIEVTAVYGTWITLGLDFIGLLIFEILARWDQVRYQAELARITDLSFKFFSKSAQEVAAAYAEEMADAALLTLDARMRSTIDGIVAKSGHMLLENGGSGGEASPLELRPNPGLVGASAEVGGNGNNGKKG